MGVFDDLIHIGENEEFLFNQWIEWDHFLIPNKPEWFRELLRNIMALFGHCMNCTSLDVAISLQKICRSSHCMITVIVTKKILHIQMLNIVQLLNVI